MQNDDCLQILFLEDDPNDIDFVRQLLSADLPGRFQLDSAGSESEYKRCLAEKRYEIVLADYTLPGYNAVEALKEWRNLYPEGPFICVSGTIGDEFAAQMLKLGATDYMLKDRLHRLPHAISQAITSFRESAESKTVKKSLQSAQKLVRDMANSSHTMTLLLNRQCNCEWADRQWLEFTGRTMAEEAGCGFRSVIHPDDRAKHAEVLRHVVESRESGSMEIRMLRRDGQYRWILCLSSPYSNADNEFCGFISSRLDVTEQKQRDSEIQRINASLKEAQRIAHIGSWDWEVATDRLFWSDESFRLLGMEPSSETVDQDMYMQFLLPGDRERVREALDRALKDRESCEVEFRVNALDGKIRHIRLRGQGQYGDEGQPVYMSGTAQDITEQREKEDVLRRMHEFNSLMLDSTTDGIVMLDRDGAILSINNRMAERFHTTAAETVGRNMLDYMPGSIYGELGRQRLDNLRSVFDSGVPNTFEDVRDGFVFSNRYHPVIQDGNVIAVTLFSTDITDHKKAAEETRRRVETEARLTVMTEFFTNVSHELKTPLSLILMQLDMMRMQPQATGKMQNLMSDATLNCYRLTRLVSNLLDITKMDSGFLKLNPRSREIVGMLRSICDSVTTYANVKGIEFSFFSSAPVKNMDVDGEKLERILLNLLSNAIKHTPKGGAISVTVMDNGDTVQVCVKDTGDGIPADRLATVFDRFVQAGGGLSRQTEGCGIGLALVKSMAELHGGRVWAESEPGKGSAFTVELPVRNAAKGRKAALVEGFDLNKKVKMELSDLYIKVDA